LDELPIETFDVVIDSDFNDNLTIEEGLSYQITGDITINGNIKNQGGVLVIEDGVFVNGNVDSKGGSITIIDSEVNGNVNIKNADEINVNGNVINGNFKIKKSNGLCIDSPNEVNGNIDGC